MQSIYCNGGSGWACNELGILALSLSGENQRGLDPAEAVLSLERGCKLGFVPACQNLIRMTSSNGPLESAPPMLEDYPIILRGSKGAITARTPSALYARACIQGWPDTCERARAAGGQ